MKTAMQELIDDLKTKEDIIILDKVFMQKYLEKEKQQTIDFSIGAYQNISRMKGVSENLISENKILFEDYYNQTYNQKQIIIDIMKVDEEDGLYNQNK
jgi:hypothetical protein